MIPLVTTLILTEQPIIHRATYRSLEFRTTKVVTTRKDIPATKLHI